MRPEGLPLDGRTWRFLQNPDAYCEASGSRLAREPTRRQFATAAEILHRLSRGNGNPVRGVLLADDVGLGKTTVAALVAWVVAGNKGNVRVLAPNTVMQRRWAEELEAHLEPLARRSSFDLDSSRLKVGKVDRLHSGRVQVSTHQRLVGGQVNLSCDLLIIDEAHRAKGEACAFNRVLQEQGSLARAMLILTATPFSISLGEFRQLLGFIGADEAIEAVQAHAQLLDDLHRDRAGRDVSALGEKLAGTARAAIEKLSPYVIRHGVDDLPTERRHFGEVALQPWEIPVEPASEGELELLLRTDRLLRLTRRTGGERTNDPRFHVGWEHLCSEIEAVEERLVNAEQEAIAKRSHDAVKKQLGLCIQRPHPKMAAVARAISSRVDAYEKVLVFCHHRATALELLHQLSKKLRIEPRDSSGLGERKWRDIWSGLLRVPSDKGLDHSRWPSDVEQLREVFLDWLCSSGVRAQVTRWLPRVPRDAPALTELLSTTRVRHRREESVPTIAQAANALFENLVDSRSASTLQVLRSISAGARFPGAMDDGDRTLGAWQPNEGTVHPLNLHTGQPDIVISLFNSPFGPDVLVTTDRLSEGIDLHRCCRLLVHYELDPSPVRTLQRNGRIRRVGSWASLTRQPIEYAYPRFDGTRDARAVEIMKVRLECFDLLLGGVPKVDVEEELDSRQSDVSRVLAVAQYQLKSANRKLTVR